MELLATVKLRVVCSDSLLSLVDRYVQGLRHAVNVIIDGKLLRLGDAHRALYALLKERYGLPPRMAIDCVREALAIAKSWFRNPKRGSRPIIKTRRMWLTPRQSYRLDLERGKVWIRGVGELDIVGWPRNLDEYRGWEAREARLVVRDSGCYLHVVFRKGAPDPRPSARAIAVDINERWIVYGYPGRIVRDPTRVEDCVRIRKHIERLQRKYSSGKYRAWLRPGVLKRIRELGKRIRSILEDFARKEAKRVVDFAAQHGRDTIVLEDLTKLIERARELKKPWRERLVLASYRRLLHWIEWQAAKRGLAVVKIDPRGTSSTCPRCGSKLLFEPGRRVKCPRCGFEADRDEVAVMNLLKKYLTTADGGTSDRPDCPRDERCIPE